jgi:signal peptidase I
MGDNRDHSWDSRYWGFVRRDAIMGRPVFIYWSVKTSADDFSEGSGGITGFLQTLAHLPSRARWSRMMREVH